jgi:hypothetical protein
VHVKFQWWAFGLTLAASSLPNVMRAQQLPAGVCDFDIADNLGRFTYGSTMHLTGRAGASTNRGEFFIINADSLANDVDHDGYNQPGPACDFNQIYVPLTLRRNLVNVDNPSLAIPADSVNLVRFGPNNEVLAEDRIFFEVTVSEDRAFAIVDPDSSALLDSVVVRGRAGQRASGVMRIANTGNVNLNDVRVTATDLRSESAVGITIPASAVSFSPGNLAGIQFGDTSRVVVNVQIPRGILGGRYRGELIVQGQGTAAQRIPLIVIVTSTRGILFGNNPVREINGDIANIAFNGDPGTTWKLAVYDMAGLVTYKTSGTVFAGAALPGGGPLVGADYAVNVIWPLRNGRGEPVASGMYLVVVESLVEGKRQLAQDKLMVIR